MVYFSGAGLPRLSWKKGRQTYVCMCVLDRISQHFAKADADLMFSQEQKQNKSI